MNLCLLSEKYSSRFKGIMGYPLKNLPFLFLFMLVFFSPVLYAQQIIKGRVTVGDTTAPSPG